jgi:hypothetical protein
MSRNQRSKTTAWSLGLLAAWALGASAGERTRLYTVPDPASSGGIEGRVIHPSRPILEVLAIPPDAPEQVYEGQITSSDSQSFHFSGLPMRIYDLVVIYEGDFYEGLQLRRGESTLTADDQQSIDAAIQKSEPFFLKKSVHRLSGETGDGNMARCICTYLRDKKSEAYMDKEQAKISATGAWRRTFKLLVLKDVGPGWQIVKTRDLYPVWAEPAKAACNHHYSAALQRVRVADSIKNIGDLDLSK